MLSSADPADENSLDEPTKVSPKTERIESAGRSSGHVFPPHSVSVLRRGFRDLVWEKRGWRANLAFF